MSLFLFGCGSGSATAPNTEEFVPSSHGAEGLPEAELAVPFEHDSDVPLPVIRLRENGMLEYWDVDRMIERPELDDFEEVEVTWERLVHTAADVSARMPKRLDRDQGMMFPDLPIQLLVDKSVLHTDALRVIGTFGQKGVGCQKFQLGVALSSGDGLGLIELRQPAEEVGLDLELQVLGLEQTDQGVQWSLQDASTTDAHTARSWFAEEEGQVVVVAGEGMLFGDVLTALLEAGLHGRFVFPESFDLARSERP